MFPYTLGTFSLTSYDVSFKFILALEEATLFTNAVPGLVLFVLSGMEVGILLEFFSDIWPIILFNFLVTFLALPFFLTDLFELYINTPL